VRKLAKFALYLSYGLAPLWGWPAFGYDISITGTKTVNAKVDLDLATEPHQFQPRQRQQSLYCFEKVGLIIFR